MLTALKGEMDNNMIIVGDFNTLLTLMDSLLDRKLIRKHKLLMTYWTSWT